MEFAALLRFITRALQIGFVSIVGAGVLAEVLRFRGEPFALTDSFSLSLEGNVPSWYSSMLLFSCALGLAASSVSCAARWVWHWRGLSFVFLGISMDEVASFHERLNQFGQTGGIFFYAWVIPFGVLVLVVGVLCLPFLQVLDAITRRRFILAGALYVGGALGVELVLGAWASAHGPFNLTYRMIDAVEEGAEIAGASFFLWALLSRLWRVERKVDPLSEAVAPQHAAY